MPHAEVVAATTSTPEHPSWDALRPRERIPGIFATQGWAKVWWDEFPAGKELHVLTVTLHDEVTAILPMYLKKEEGRSVLRFVGGIDLTDYLGPICPLSETAAAADALVGWLRTTDVEWDEFDGHNLPVPAGFAEHLVESADRHGMDFELDQEETSAILELPDSWETYLGNLSSKDRHELRRKQRRLWKEHPDAKARTATPETLEVDLATFIDLHRGTEGLKGHFMRPEIATFFERVARAFMPLGWLRLDLLEVGDKTLSATFGFEFEGTFYLYNSAYDPDFARLSPGMMLVAELIRESIDRGLHTFDFLRGPEKYKYRMGAAPVPLHNVRIKRAAI